MTAYLNKERKNNRQRILAGILLAVAFVLIYPHLNAKQEIHDALRTIHSFGVWEAPIYFIFYCLASIFFVPLSVLTFGAGVLLGSRFGFMIAWFGANIAASIAFLCGRYLAKEWMFKLLKNHPKFQILNDAVSKAGWKAVFLLRLVPLMPYTLVNTSFGLSGITFKEYLAGTMAGTVPFVVFYVLMGSLAKDISQVGMQNPELRVGEITFMILGLIIAAGLLWRIQQLIRTKAMTGVKGDL